MAKESSFDIVSTVDMQEVDNAFQQAKKELPALRFSDSGAEISLDKSAGTLTVTAPAEFVASQVIDVIGSKLIKRGIDLTAVKWGDSTLPPGGGARCATVVNGIDKETAGKINKDIKAQKLKGKVTIEGDKLRVSSPSRDTLQEVIAFLRGQDYGQPLQYVNYRYDHRRDRYDARQRGALRLPHHDGVREERGGLGRHCAALARSRLLRDRRGVQRRRHHREYLLVHPGGHRGEHRCHPLRPPPCPKCG